MFPPDSKPTAAVSYFPLPAAKKEVIEHSGHGTCYAVVTMIDCSLERGPIAFEL